MIGLLLAAGLMLATAAVQAQITRPVAATGPQVHGHVAIALLYRSEPEAQLAPRVPHAQQPQVCKLPPYPTSVAYSTSRRRFGPHIEYVERTYVVVEDSIPDIPSPHIMTPPRRSK